MSGEIQRAIRAVWRWYTGKFGILLTCVLLAFVAAMWWLLRPGDDQAADITKQLGIDIPSNASDVITDDPAVALQGGCSGVEFLMPTAEWREYVGEYVDVATLEPTFNVATSCGNTLIECEQTYNTQPGSDSRLPSFRSHRRKLPRCGCLPGLRQGQDQDCLVDRRLAVDLLHGSLRKTMRDETETTLGASDWWRAR